MLGLIDGLRTISGHRPAGLVQPCRRGDLFCRLLADLDRTYIPAKGALRSCCMTLIDLSGRVAVVTGAGRGLGRSHALALAARGAAVVINDLGAALDGAGASMLPAEDVVEEIRRSGGRAIAESSDISSEEGGAALVNRTIETFGRIDILVNNAGILRDRSAHKMQVADAEAVVRVHLHGASVAPCQPTPGCGRRDMDESFQTSSASGLFGNFGQANYGAAKAGLIGLTKVIAIEGRNNNIFCNAISPCAATRMTEAGFADMAGLFGPDLVSPLVVYLASENCRITGEIFSVGGGADCSHFCGT